MRCPDHRAAPSAEFDAPDGAAACVECAQWLRAARRLDELAGQAPGPSEGWTRGLMGRLDAALGGE
ncbi:hypothetical protein OG871_07405 [Kitasatospora sp. NBC_00374]|uniref:hypothetical protein n=1 Tax=Kitasatospora sp. NBC_00374 TaxID=2975964 RepID=UPI00324D9994